MPSLLALSSLCARFGRGLFLPRIAGRAAALAAITVGLATWSHAQTTLLVSNMSASFNGNNFGVASGTYDMRLAGSFTVGSSGAYLASMSLSHSGGSGSGFSISLYSNGADRPGTLIETLSGPTAPEEGGLLAYTSVGGTTFLGAGTTYWWVAHVMNSEETLFYVPMVSETGESGASGWTIGDTGLRSLNGGSSWSSIGANTMRFSVSGSASAPVPEPSTYAALAGGTALGLAAWRRRRAQAFAKAGQPSA